MHDEEQGRGQPLVLLHGGTGGSDFRRSTWDILAPAFAEGYRGIRIERRAHGRSNNPAGCLACDQIASNIAAFIERCDLGPNREQDATPRRMRRGVVVFSGELGQSSERRDMPETSIT
jgi:pimeloyl-ACP methyl ester carboxylesterase